MNRHELGLRNRKLAEKRHQKRGPSGPFPRLTRAPHEEFADPPERILVLCPGDPTYVLFSTPALYALRTVYPQAHIAAGVGLEAEPFLRHNREINTLHVIPTLGRLPEAIRPGDLGDWPASLEAAQYDVAIVAAPTHWAACLLAARARIPCRIGADDGQGAEEFLTESVQPGSNSHVVAQNMQLVEALVGAPLNIDRRLRFWMDETIVALAYRSALADLMDETGPLVAIMPGSGSQPADWNAESWAFVADHLILQHEARVVLVGDEKGKGQRQAVARAMRFEPQMVDEVLDPLYAAALFARCAMVMGGHSGLLHLAVALERPALILYGPHDTAEVGPWGVPARTHVLRSEMLCAPCRLPHWPDDRLENHPCVRDIDSFFVLEAALELMVGQPTAEKTGLQYDEDSALGP